jgi:AcrR family transcriptional regulator
MAPEPPAASIRARVRAELTGEIKTVARRHLAAEGANLSLRAVARDMGMVSSALYRYFPSRDDLLTALIIDGYNAMGEAAEQADAAVADRSDLAGRYLAVAHALRDWAVARPYEYALLYGSPVPGYAAPPDTIGPALRPVIVLGRILADAVSAGGRAGPAVSAGGPVGPAVSAGGPVGPAAAAHGDPRISAALRAELRRAAEAVAPGVPEAVLARGMLAWTQLFGALNFEIFGRLNNVIEELPTWFDRQARLMAQFIGLT